MDAGPVGSQTSAAGGGIIGQSELCAVFIAIDVARAQRSKQNAEERMKRHESQKEFDRAEKKLKRALNRLMVADKKH